MVRGQKFGPQYVAPGQFEVGLYVEGDPEGHVHWQQFKAKSYDAARAARGQVYRELAIAAAGRIEAHARALQRTAQDLRTQFGTKCGPVNVDANGAPVEP